MSAATSHSLDRRALIAGIGAAACGIVSSPATAAPGASAWAVGLHSRIRLTDAGLAKADGPHVAVIEIALDRGFKTYWRSPGDSGVPPTFFFDGSENAADIKVHFPAPTRFDDGAGGHAIGYARNLVELPVTFRRVDPSKPATLNLRMDYAVCEKICVPAAGAASLVLPPSKAASARAAALVGGLPAVTPLGGADPLAVVKLQPAGKAETFRINVRLPGAEDADLFVEAPSPWVFDAAAPVRGPGGMAVFTVTAIDKDKSPDCRGVEITMTLVQGNRAVETTTWLDVALLRA
jgi:DsbC/DsbD-like thiol-disulfide interchange protein